MKKADKRKIRKFAPDTRSGCWCNSYEDAWRRYKYWHRAFCISMFFHGAISLPVIIAVVMALISGIG